MPCGRAMEDNVMPSGGVRRLVIKFYAISAPPEEESKVKRERERVRSTIEELVKGKASRSWKDMTHKVGSDEVLPCAALRWMLVIILY